MKDITGNFIVLPCPFCGGKAQVKKNRAAMVSCTGCTASTFQSLNDELSALRDWNKRTPPTSDTE